MTLADEDTNSILTDNANMAFQGKVAMRVTQPSGQLWNQATQVTWWSNFELIFNKSECANSKQIQIWFQEISRVWNWEMQQYLQICPNLELMQMAPSGGQIYNYCKWRHVVAKFSPSLGVNFWVRCASGNVLDAISVGQWVSELVGQWLIVSEIAIASAELASLFSYASNCEWVSGR